MAWRMVEYLCANCGLRFEELVTVPPPRFSACKRKGCVCKGHGVPAPGHACKVAELVISAPMYRHITGKTSVTVTRGKPEEPPPGALQTCPPPAPGGS